MNTWTQALLVVALASGVSERHQEPKQAQKPDTCPDSFLDAIRSGDAQAVSSNLFQGCFSSAATKLEKTQFHLIGAVLGKVDVDRVFIDRNYDVNARVSLEVTPLHFSLLRLWCGIEIVNINMQI